MPPKSTRRNPAPGPTRPGAGGTRVAIVTRISTDEVNQPYSLEAQATGLEAFVASQPGQAITHRFVDQASGATLERPGLQAALASAKAGEFDVLLVYRIDRISRSIVGLMTIVEALDAAGVALRSATEPIDTHGPVGRMLLQLLGIFAEFERSLLIDRITKGFERKAARGEWFAGPGPFGYRLEPATKTLAAEPAEAAVVQAMFSAYVDERLGATALAKRLNDTGQRNRGGKLWSNQTVLRVLRNPVYVGKITHGDDIHEGKHDPIIDTSLYARVQAILEQRAAESTTTAPTLSEYLLSGKLRCRACGGAYVGAGRTDATASTATTSAAPAKPKAPAPAPASGSLRMTSKPPSPDSCSTSSPTANSSRPPPPKHSPKSPTNAPASKPSTPAPRPSYARPSPPWTATSTPSRPAPCPPSSAPHASPSYPPAATSSPQIATASPANCAPPHRSSRAPTSSTSSSPRSNTPSPPEAQTSSNRSSKSSSTASRSPPTATPTPTSTSPTPKSPGQYWPGLATGPWFGWGHIMWRWRESNPRRHGALQR
jgi:DNA invertase Pin-like site-specific DNA recombinase